jgi:transposase-like protein
MPKRAYDIAFKQKAVELALKASNRQAARELNIDEKRIREWRQQVNAGKFLQFLFIKVLICIKIFFRQI